jgi:galactokinase
LSEIFVPGRLCLFGEHSDWAAGYRSSHSHIAPGYCLVSGTDQGLRAEIEPMDDRLEITTVLPSGEEIGPARIANCADELGAAAKGADFFSYIAGTAAVVRERFDSGGLRLHISSDLPVRKGLSSSAAACVLTARALSRVYGLGLDRDQEMAIAYEGERRTGSECGRMDQVCAYGRQVTALRFDADELEIDEVSVGGPIYLLVVDLRRGKDTRRILADLNACFPDTEGPVAAGVREALGTLNHELHLRARVAVEGGDSATLGALMTEAQQRFDAMVAPACPELESPRLHEVLANKAVAEFAYGAKGVGSQGDGCAQIVARGRDEREALAANLNEDLRVRSYELTLEPSSLA